MPKAFNRHKSTILHRQVMLNPPFPPFLGGKIQFYVPKSQFLCFNRVFFLFSGSILGFSLFLSMVFPLWPGKSPAFPRDKTAQRAEVVRPQRGGALLLFRIESSIPRRERASDSKGQIARIFHGLMGMCTDFYGLL